jgi:signal transduction histidine kinase
MVDGQLAAQVRIGYFEPTLSEILIGSSIHARIALIVFLLMPLAQLWLHREIQPLASVARELDADEGLAGSLFESGNSGAQDISSLAEKIRSFSRLMDDKTQQMSRERMALLASSKVLAHQKGRADTIVETIPDAVIALEPTGRVAAVNQRAIAVLRKSREELVGSDIAVWSPSESVTQLVARHVGKGGRVLRAESVDYSPEDSMQRRHRASIHPAANGSLSVVVIHDISEAEAARKSQAEFLAHMAHELKAPLNVMALYSESLLEKEAREDSVRIDACNVIADEIDRLNGLINNIFSISRIEGGAVSLERQRVRLADMLQDLFESASRDGETLALEFSIELPSDLGPVFVDKQLFSIAIKNILSNAIKYNRPEGSVAMTVANDETGLSIRIRDSGPGIPEEEIGMIFEKFYRSEHDSVRKVSGHGLGLALVKEIVGLHGGEIQVHSEIGKGSEFALLFDRSAPIFREGV